MEFKEILQKVGTFQKATGQRVSQSPELGLIAEGALRFNLMREENLEYADALRSKDLTEVLDACVDQLYILAGTINHHGLQSVMLEAFERVHDNNMTKVMPDGSVRRNVQGKILKPDGFIPVKLTDLINN
jgi:predicted HAD superfamily Cof-like phosphohydrolase